jgi:fructokinase
LYVSDLKKGIKATMRVLAFGEILWDIIEDVPHLGGAPLNFVAHLAKYGADTSILSRLGRDTLGTNAFEKISNYGVGTNYIQWDAQYPTGTVIVTLDKGQPDYTISKNAAYDFIEYDEFNANVNDKAFDVFYFGTLAQRETGSRQTLLKITRSFTFKHIFYDVNLRKDCFEFKNIVQSLYICTILKLNSDEVDVISRMILKRPLSTFTDFCEEIAVSYNIQIVIITAAEKGCYIFCENKLNHIPGHEVKVVDAVGAGDAFSAAFMFDYSTSGDAQKAAIQANRVGAFVASQHGAIPDYPDYLLARENEC